MPTAISLNIAIIGGGVGGLSAGLALRQAGHQVTLYDRSDFTDEKGAGLSITSNGSRWLETWGVDIQSAKPVVVKKLVRRGWGDGKVLLEAPMGDYKEKFGYDSYGFYRPDIHAALLSSCLSTSGPGTPCQLQTGYQASFISPSTNEITFTNGQKVIPDLIIGADGIHSITRESIGIIPDITALDSCAFRSLLLIEKLRKAKEELGLDLLDDVIKMDALQFWGTPQGHEKIVMGPCHDGEMVVMYCIFPVDEKQALQSDDWSISATPEDLLATFPDLDPKVRKVFKKATNIHVWRQYSHQPYPFWTKNNTALLGDAAHPMLPDQAQGFSQAIEDAAALGLLFGKGLFDGNIGKALKMYEEVRKERATRVQDASRRARDDHRERIGWKTEGDRVGKLTTEEVCGYDMVEHIKKVVKDEEL